MNHTLQINTAGAWRNVIKFIAADTELVASVVTAIVRSGKPEGTYRIVENSKNPPQVMLAHEQIVSREPLADSRLLPEILRQQRRRK